MPISGQIKRASLEARDGELWCGWGESNSRLNLGKVT
nr:MAG TPA: hypothetical protein [Bacteriophage sp.]